MMNWLWIAAVALLGVFFSALCWHFFSAYLCLTCKKKRNESFILPTTVHETAVCTVPSAPPSTPGDSPVVNLTHGKKKLHDIIFSENGIPTLDLHRMTVAEATSATKGFLQYQQSAGFQQIQIITGKGLHSEGMISKLKPSVFNILIGEGVPFRESSKGGSYLVYY